MPTGIIVLTNASLTVGGTDLSDHVQSLTVVMNADDVDVTAMGSVSHQHLPGLRNDSFQVVFFQDYASGKVDATLAPLLGSSTGTTLVAKADAAAVSATNPTYTMVGILLDYQPIAGAVGTANQTTVTFACAQGTASKITRATA